MQKSTKLTKRSKSEREKFLEELIEETVADFEQRRQDRLSKEEKERLLAHVTAHKERSKNDKKENDYGTNSK